MADGPKVPLTNKPNKTNWVERFHALPKDSWIRRAAEHIKAKGKPEALAIPFAVRAAERICATGDTNLPGLQQVNPKSKAEACAALVVWKAAAARAKASDLTARAEIREINLAAAYIGYEQGWSDHLPRGATAAYLDLAAERDVVDLAFSPDQSRGFHGRWVAMAQRVKNVAHENGVFISEKQRDTVAAHALAHGEPRSVSKGIGGNVVTEFANGQLHSFSEHGSHERLDNLPASGGAKPPLSSAERQAIVAHEMLKALKEIAPNFPGNEHSPQATRSGGQIAAIKGIVRKRAMERIGDEERRRALDAERRASLPKRIDSRAMTLSAVREALVFDLAREQG